MRFTTITTALLASCALAAPAPEAAHPRIPKNTATCHLDYLSFYGKWTINIGRPYLNGKGCDHVKDVIDKNFVMMSFKCKDNGHGQTLLQFKTDVATKKVNQKLQAAYPMIPFVAKNTCDPYIPV